MLAVVAPRVETLIIFSHRPNCQNGIFFANFLVKIGIVKNRQSTRYDAEGIHRLG